MNDNIIKILITAKDEASSVLKGIKAQAAETADASKRFATGLMVAATATAGFIGYGAKVAGDLEASRAGFITLLGSAQAADEALAMIKKDAASTPFELPGLIQANQLLTSVTKDAAQSETLLMNVGKALSAMGKGQPELDRIIVNLQQIGATGRATMMDVRQFAFAGIPIFEMLSQATGKTGQELEDMISSGGVTFEMLEQMFNNAGAAGGRFADAFKNQAGGFNQILANLQDTVTIAMSDIVTKSGAFDIIKDAMAAVGDWVNTNKDAIADGISSMFSFIKDNGAIIAGIILGALVPALFSMAAGVWATLAPLLPFMAAGALIALLLNNLANSMGGWGAMLAAVQPILQQVGNFVGQVLTNAFQILLNVWNFLKPSIMALWQGLQQLFGALMNLWNVIAPVLIPVLQVIAVIIGVVIVAAVWLFINVLNIFVGIITWAINLAAGIFSWLGNVIGGIVKGASSAFGNFGKFLGDVWNGIKNTWSAVTGFFTGIFNGAVNGIRNIFNGVVGIVQGVWNRVTGIFSAIGSFVGNAVGGAVRGAVNGALSMVQNMANGFIGMINGAIDLINKIPGVSIGKIGLLSLPRMATGGIVQATSGGTAIIAGEGGQNEWVVPESKMASLINQINGRVGGAAGGGINITVEYNGRGQFSQSDAVDMAKQIRNALQAQGLGGDFNQVTALR